MGSAAGSTRKSHFGWGYGTRGYGPRSGRVSFTGTSLTHFGGLLVLQRFMQQLGLRSLFAHHVRFNQRNTRYAISASLLAWLYPIILGLGRIDAIRLLQRNGVFQYLTGLPTYPDPQTLRRFLVRFGESGLSRFLRLHDPLRQTLVNRPRRLASIILDWDTTVLTVYGKQQRAALGFNPKQRGRPSYLPRLCFEGQTRDGWEASSPPGDTQPSSVIRPALERAFAKRPPHVREIRVRADAACYAHKLIECLEETRAFYAIPARLTKPLKARGTAARYRCVSGTVSAAELWYQPTGGPGPRRFMAIRRPAPEEPSGQLTLWRLGKYTSQVIVTNLALTPLYVWRFYHDRAGAELVIRALKEAYALGKLPTQIWAANVASFQLVVLAYNLLNWVKRLCVAPAWQRLTLHTLRNQRLLIPAELIRPQGRPVLKMPSRCPHQAPCRDTLKRIARFRFNLRPAAPRGLRLDEHQQPLARR